MNMSTLVGFLSALGVFIAALTMSTNNFKMFFDLHAGLIVVGGTLTASFICFSLPKVFGLLKVFFKRMLGKNKRNYQLIIDEVLLLAQANKRGKGALEDAVTKITDPFIREAGEILLWLESDVPMENIRYLLETRAETHFERYMQEANIFSVMAKFPPAFGLMGTTLGMIVLLQSLGNPNAKNMIGPAMSIALVATLYGIVAANFIFVPISENLKQQSEEDLVARRMVVEGIMLIGTEMPSRFVEEHLKSFLLPKERALLKSSKGAGANSGSKAA